MRNEHHGRRVTLRPLVAADFPQWSEVRRRNVDWLTKWEPRPPEGYPNDAVDRNAFAAEFGADPVERFADAFASARIRDLLEVTIDRVALSAEGRLLASEACVAFLPDRAAA